MTPIRLAVSARSRRGVTAGRAAAATAFTQQIAATENDALEEVTTGDVSLTDPGALGLASVTDAVVLTGFRIVDVPYEQGALIQDARLWFTARGSNTTDEFVVRFRAQAIDDAPAFTTTNGDISARALTTAYVDWATLPWTLSGQRDADTRTPDLSAIVQEVINRAGWVAGNSIVIVAERISDWDRRRYYGVSDDPSNAPYALVNTTDITGPDPVPPPEGEYTLLGDPDFDIDTLSGVARTEYDRIISDINSSQNAAYLQGFIDKDDLFWFARTFHTYIEAILNAFRFTGDLRLLDHADEWVAKLYPLLKVDVGWGPNNTIEPGRHSEFRMWWHRYGSDDRHLERDGYLNDVKLHALLAEMAYALDLNRNHASPSARDYAASADLWKDYLRHSESGYWAKTHGKHTDYGKGTRFEWFQPHPDLHHWISAIHLFYYWWRLFGDAAAKHDLTRATDPVWRGDTKDEGSIDDPDSHYAGEPEHRVATSDEGSALVWHSNCMWRSTKYRRYLMQSGYAGSNYIDALDLHFEDFDEWGSTEAMVRIARAISRFQLTDSDNVRWNPTSIPSSAAMSPDVGGDGVSRAGIAAHATLRRTRSVMAESGLALLAHWDATDHTHACFDYIRSQHPTVVTTRTTVGFFIRAFLRGL